ncbi:MAG TPA: hypothetical protein VIQ30_02610 [Pseudonocardia sp.]
MDDRHRHRCQLSDELADDLRVLMNFIALAPFALDAQPEEPTIRIPMQRSRTAAEAEALLFERLPRTRRRPPEGFPRPLRTVPPRPRPGGAA